MSRLGDPTKLLLGSLHCRCKETNLANGQGKISGRSQPAPSLLKFWDLRALSRVLLESVAATASRSMSLLTLLFLDASFLSSPAEHGLFGNPKEAYTIPSLLDRGDHHHPHLMAHALCSGNGAGS